MQNITPLFDRALALLPQQGVSFLFAYGSRVTPQAVQVAEQSSMEKNMLDLIIAVEEPLLWHSLNMEKNPHHYSFLRFLGSRRVSDFQQIYGAQLYFNTLVQVDDFMLKYGVIKTDHLVVDLLDWKTLFISGRLHKPHHKLVQPKTKELIDAMDVNLKSAVHAALLQLPESFYLTDFYTKITELSYKGDFRMIIGEDKHKIVKIVQANQERFREIYLPLLETLDYVQVQGNRVIQDLSIASTYHHLELLPKHPQWNLQRLTNKDGRNRDLEEVIWSLAHGRNVGALVENALKRIVFYYSVTQSFKNIFSAGIKKSIVYSSKKLYKMLKSIRSKS